MPDGATAFDADGAGLVDPVTEGEAVGDVGSQATSTWAAAMTRAATRRDMTAARYTRLPPPASPDLRRVMS